MTGGPVGREVALPRLDVVLGLAAGAVQRLVKPLGAAAGKICHDEAGVAALGARLDAGDDALDPAPALGGVIELLETPLLAARRGRFEALGRGLLQRLDVAPQRGIGGEAEDEIDAI